MPELAEIRVGSRGSPLALRQTTMFLEQLRLRRPTLAGRGAIEQIVITTTGDRVDATTLKNLGGKGLFSKEIDEALLENRIDIGVHSMKDLPTILPEGIALHSVLPREDVRDAFISPVAANLDALPAGATVGTVSLRRQSQILNRRPDLKVVPLRGNVDTRIAKLESGVVDATLLAMAGLKRLGREGAVTAVLDTNDMLPAVGQGALGATCRSDDVRANAILAELTEPRTRVALIAERAMLTALGGSCYTPVAGHARYINDDLIEFEAILAHPDGGEFHRSSGKGAPAVADDLGQQVAAELLEVGRHILIECIESQDSRYIPAHPEMEQEN